MALEHTATSLAPGFRFHPTDEELVRYYLKRKVMHKPLRFDPISVIDVYKSEPWDLPGKARLKSRDLEWYFFSMLDKKYSNGSKTNRATEKGYWKTTGKDRPIKWNSRAVGMKKTLVYHQGRAPKGERSNWVMHEYRLVDDELGHAGIAQDSFVLCRIFQKSGTGPKNGEQYGAPFVEEEWDDVDNDGFEFDVLYSDALLALPEDNYVESGEFFPNSNPNSINNEISPFKGSFPDKICYESLPEDSPEVDIKPSTTPTEEEKILTNFPIESYFDGETFDSNENNLLTSFSPDTTDFDAVADYLTFFDADDSIPDSGNFENKPNVKDEPEEASCSSKTPQVEYEPEAKPSFVKRKSHMLGGHVSEYPIKEGLLLHPGQSSTSIHVTAGLIRIETVGYAWPDGKSVAVEVIGGKLGFWNWVFLILLWVVMLSVSYRVVLHMTAKM